MSALLTLFDGDTFSPRRLFLSSTIGAIYAYDDFAYLYQKSDGSTPVTALEQPVGFRMDERYGGARGDDVKSSGAARLIGTATAATFNTSTGAGTAVRVDASNFSGVRFSGLTANSFYALAVNNTGSASLTICTGDINGTGIVDVTAGSSGTYFALSNATGEISISPTNNGTTIGFTASAVRLLPGLHAYQATDAARPVLSARYNLLLATATLSTQSVTTLAASYTMTFTGTGTVTLSGTATGAKSAGSNVFTATAGTLTLTVSGSVTLADLRLTADANSRLPAYQRVTTATDYDSAGFPRFLRIDATDDFLQTASVDPGTDKVFVCAGATKMSDSGASILMESSANVGSNAGTFAVYASNNSASHAALLNGSALAAVQGETYTAPITDVISAIFDISRAATLDEITLRVNGAVPSTITTPVAGPAGTGNFTAQPIYIGARAGTSLRLNNGRIYPMVICFKAVTAGEIAATEAWVNQRTKGF